MWKKIDSKKIFEHPRLTLEEDTVELPDGSHVPYLKYAARHDSVTAVCIRGDEVLIQSEYSYPPNEVLYQFPGGKVEMGEAPDAAIRRELIEESGIAASDLKQMGWFYVDNRRSDAKMFVYLASEPKQVEKTGGDHEEDISSQWIGIDELNRLVKSGEIVNGPLLVAWSFFLTQR